MQPDLWSAELEELLVRTVHRFGRVDLRRRMQAYVHGLLGPVGRKTAGNWLSTPVTAPLRACSSC
ncbi:hypothetical protein LIX60_30945 [Streptomyces sp. S07_1.15]|uniref:hypothetical protein n=1 Tax=Streptomyces sp. S07_1.15 TaxID=2873925 RepID=UPI001D15D7EC|nr:hypothetical protein [Streptomyces sp. S07_1.15]MCC3655800.1 hypothetical protein [Streptomyces sp. S07_1.15]